MKNKLLIPIALLATIFFSSCEAIGTIFEAGMWWGILLVVGVIILVIWLIGRGRKG